MSQHTVSKAAFVLFASGITGNLEELIQIATEIEARLRGKWHEGKMLNKYLYEAPSVVRYLL